MGKLLLCFGVSYGLHLCIIIILSVVKSWAYYTLPSQDFLRAIKFFFSF